MKKQFIYLKNVFYVGICNISVPVEYRDEVTEHLFSYFKIYPIFLTPTETEKVGNIHNLLKYVCYNKTNEIKQRYLTRPIFLQGL